MDHGRLDNAPRRPGGGAVVGHYGTAGLDVCTDPPMLRERLRDEASGLVVVAMLVLVGAHTLGIASDVVYVLVTFTSVVSAFVGLRWRRPAVRWPWVMFAAAAVLWTVTGVVEGVVQASGDLTRSRSLLPDVFAIPGYLCIGAALLSLLRTRAADRERSALLDGLMLSAGGTLIIVEVLVAPALRLDEVFAPALFVVLVYPMMSMVLLILAGRLAFAPGDRSYAFTLLLIGIFALHIGDTIYALGEIGRIELPGNLDQLPYLLAPTCFSGAVLHPTVRAVAKRSVLSHDQLGRGRALTVTVALAIPTVILAVHAEGLVDIVVVSVTGVLVAAAVIRILSAMRAQAQAADQMYYRATHDELTGLPGRALLFQHLDDVSHDAHVRSLTLMFIDLDRFKQINDTLGHQAGDELLVTATARVLETVRSTDVVYRLSGDEFVVLAPNVDERDAESLAARVREAIRRPFVLQVGRVYSSASIGVATAPTDEPARLHALLGEADEAMYSSKQNGRDVTTRFDVSMRERTERRLYLERQLHLALDHGDIQVHYQPIVAGTTWDITGFEALARWTLNGEQIRPDEFIPVAEESGLIVPLGAAVLDAACAQLARWRRTTVNGDQLTMSVNLSPRQIRSGDIVDVVADAIVRHGLPGDALWLEITESVMAEDSVTTAAVFAALRRMGIQLSVDDFGTGYSSLSYLKRFPLSRVKIDRSFVTGICFDESDHSLVAAVIAMAGALGLQPVAEGVERPEQALALRELGCDTMQGFLFGKPLSADDTDALLAMKAPDSPVRLIETRRPGHHQRHRAAQ